MHVYVSSGASLKGCGLTREHVALQNNTQHQQLKQLQRWCTDRQARVYSSPPTAHNVSSYI